MSTYEIMVVIGMALWIAIALGLLVAVGLVLSLLRRAREPVDRVAEAVGDVKERIAPTIRNVERATEDVNYIVSVLRTDASSVGRTVRRTADSTERMVEMLEERVAEITGLLEVVQEEAEETFLSTASLLRSFRNRSLADEPPERPLAGRGRRG